MGSGWGEGGWFPLFSRFFNYGELEEVKIFLQVFFFLIVKLSKYKINKTLVSQESPKYTRSIQGRTWPKQKKGQKTYLPQETYRMHKRILTIEHSSSSIDLAQETNILTKEVFSLDKRRAYHQSLCDSFPSKLPRINRGAAF